MDAGGNVNVVNNWGVSPLMFAAQEDHFETAKVLIENGADASKTDVDGRDAQKYYGKKTTKSALGKLFAKVATLI